MTTSTGIAEKFASIVGAANLRAATASDVMVGCQPEYVVSPGTEHELAAILSFATETGVAVIPRGGGTKLDWGNPPRRGGIVLSTQRLHRVLEHAWADLTVTVEAGCTVQALQNTLGQHGQRLAIDALWPDRATIGGLLSTNDSGVLRVRFGGLRDLIIGVTLALPDGTLASSGGKVVKNVAGYDLPKLATGAFGTLGVITRAVFRLHPLPWAASSISCIANDIPAAQRLIALLLDSNLAYSALQGRIVSTEEREISIDLLFEATDSGRAAQIARVKSLADPVPISEANSSVWNARENLHSAAVAAYSNSALVKMSARPADAMNAIADLRALSENRAKLDAVVQATGLGTILLKGDAEQLRPVLENFRKRMEAAGGSMVILSNGHATKGLDAWGDPGDAVDVMRALKKQLDPKDTLNPGRFVGGI